MRIDHNIWGFAIAGAIAVFVAVGIAFFSHHQSDPSPESLVEAWSNANTICRGSGPPESDAGCSLRERIGAQLEAAGWCLGEGAQYGYEVEWAPCGKGKFASRFQTPERDSAAEGAQINDRELTAETEPSRSGTSDQWYLGAAKLRSCVPLREAMEVDTPEQAVEWFTQRGQPMQYIRRNETITMISPDGSLEGAIAMVKGASACWFVMNSIGVPVNYPDG